VGGEGHHRMMTTFLTIMGALTLPFTFLGFVVVAGLLWLAIDR
jgi:hypothetical protein